MLGASQRVSFEVQYLKDDHWLSHCVCNTETEARRVAATVLPRWSGVRILREFQRSGGRGTAETVIHAESRVATPRAIALVPVERSPYCTVHKDILRRDSRTVISRLLRQYLDYRGLTASELLHHAGEARRLMNFESLLPDAVSRVASLQVRDRGQDSRARRDAVLAMLDDLCKKAASAASAADLPYPREVGLAAVMDYAAARGGADGEEVAYLAKVILCRDMVNMRGLLSKAEWLAELMAEVGGNATAACVLDQLMADVLSAPDLIREMLGRQRDLATALGRLIDIAGGAAGQADDTASSSVVGLVSLWAGGPYGPETRATLLDFLARQIRGGQRLCHGDDAEQRAAYLTLLRRLMRDDGVLGGGPMADALVAGYGRFIEQGGATGRRRALDAVVYNFPIAGDRLRFLASLSNAAEAGEQELIAAKMADILQRAPGMRDLVAPGLVIPACLAAAGTVYRVVADCGLQEADRDELTDRLDKMIASHIIDARVIQALDDTQSAFGSEGRMDTGPAGQAHPAAILRCRATRLIRFAAGPTLVSPRARTMIRDQILGQLRQPDFETSFVADIVDAATQVSVLRDFHTLLTQADFLAAPPSRARRA